MENFSFKRFLSLVMAFVMVLSYVPANAFAVEGEPSDIVVEEPVVEEPVVEEPVVEEPVDEEPVVEEPVVEEPVVEEPVVEEPVVEEPVVEEPVVEEPVVEEPVVEEPVVEEPEVEEPVVEEPEVEEPVEEETEEEPEEDELVVKVQAMLDALPELPSVVTQAQLDDYQAKLAEIYPYLQTMTNEQIAQLKGLQEKLYPIVTLAEPVAKVGTIEYGTIDEAIKAWTNNTTLTLLADVTLPDVVTLKSTEHHILDLGTYTMTAARDKNAFVIQACGTGDAERTAITIKAAKDEKDEEYLGTINAGSKCVVYYKYADGGISGNDRPIIKIEGGKFYGSTSSWGTAGIYTIGTAARKCATLNISGGTFECSINGSGKSKLIISGGTFNYSVGSQGDSTALRLISGGTFKTFGFMTADSNNTKFWFGTSMGNSNVGVHVDDDGYIVVGGPVVTEAGDIFAASSTNYSGANSLLQYSSAKDNGLYYTSVKEALADNNTGSVTVYVGELDMTGINFKGTIVAPEGKTVTVTNAPEGLKTEGNVIIVKPVAKIGDASYNSLADAVAAAQAGDTITVIADIADETVKVNKNLTITGSVAAKNVSIDAVEGCAELTVSGLTFSGNSWINSGAAGKLTVSGVTANVTPSNADYTNSRSAFISLGRNEGKELELTVEKSNIVANGGANPILGWASIKKATLTDNTFGSKDAHQRNSDSVKFMAIADGAEFIISDNTIYSDYNGIVFAQNTTRENAYTATIENNQFYGGADHIWIEISGGDTCYATINAASSNTVNGNAMTIADLKARIRVIKNWSSYVGVDVVTDESGMVIGGTLAFHAEDVIAEGYEKDETGKVVETVNIVAKIGDAEYESLADAAAAAQAGDEIELLADVTLTEALILPAGVIFNGNGQQINGTIYAGGDLTFKGYTKVTGFSASYYNRTITIGEGACLEVTGTGRVTLGYGNTFNITGSIEKAKNADKANVQPSLIIPGGMSVTGGNDATMNVTNAYVKIGSTSSKNSAANGKFTFNFTNSIVEFTNQFTLAEPTSGMNPTFVVNIKDSVMTTGTKFIVAASNTTTEIDNSTVTLSSYLRNSGKMTLKNGSVLTGKTTQFGENGGNDGSIIVDNSTLSIIGGSAPHALDGKGTGSLTVVNDGNANVDYMKESAVTISADSTFATTEISGNSSVEIDATNVTAPTATAIDLGNTKIAATVKGNGNLTAKIENGKVVLAERQLNGSGTEADPYTIGSLEELKLFANKANAGNNYAGKYVKLTADIDLANEAWTPIKKFNGTFDGDNHKISNVNVVGTGNMGFFAEVADQTEHVTGTVKNVTFDNVTIISESGNGNAGPIAYAKLGARITNVKVTGTVNIKGYRGVGGIVGAGFPVLDSCSVEAEGTITATFWGVGGILGFASDKGAKATNSTVVSTGNGLTIHGDLGGVGAVTGTPHGAATKNATVTGVEITSNNNYYMGYVDASGTISGKVTVTDVAVKVNGEEIIGNDALVTINNTPYFSLQDAANNVKDGDIIVLQSNITFNEDAYFNNGGWKDGAGFVTDKNFTIDLNNHTIGQNGHLNDYLLFFKNNGTKANEITIKNGTLDAGTTAFCAICTSSSNAQQITINLENVNLINNNSNGAVAKIRGGSVLNVKAGTVITGKDSYVGIEAVGDKTVVNIYEGAVINQNGTTNYVGSLAGVSYGATLNVYGGSGVSAKGGFIAMTSGGTINISGGEWTANNDGTPANGNNSVLIAQSDKNTYTNAGDSIVNVTGGTFKGGYNCYGAAAGDAQLNISGGKFNADPKAYVVEDYEVNGENGEYTVVETAKAVAINGKGYRTLSAAITAAKAGDTITFLDNINENVTINKDLIIDGAKKNYTGKMTVVGVIDVTFQNINFEKGNIFDDDAADIHGNMIVKNCNFDGNGSIDYAITQKGADKLVIENCTAKNYKTGAVYIKGNVDTISVKDVEITNVAAAFNMTSINAGTFENVTVKDATYGLHSPNYNTRTFTLTGCNFDCKSPVYVPKKGTATVTVVFEGNNTFANAAEYSSNYTEFVLNEGAVLTANQVFKNKITTNVADHKVVYENGAYKLGKLNVAQIGSTTYSSLEEAVAAANVAKKSTTITLLEDISGPGVVINSNVNVTIDFNGKTYTITEPATEEGYGFMLEDSGKAVTLKNGILEVAENAGVRILVQNFANLTVTDMKLYGTYLTTETPYVLSNNSGTVKVNGATEITVKAGGMAFDACAKFKDALPTVQIYNTVKINGYAANLENEAAAFIDAPVKYPYKTTDSSYQTYYATMEQALEKTSSIALVHDYAGPGLVINKKLTFDFNGHKYTVTEPVGSAGTETNGFQIMPGIAVTLKNGTLEVDKDAASKFYILVQNYANLTVTDMTLDGTNLGRTAKSYVLSNNSGTVKVNTTTEGETKIIVKEDGFAFDACKFADYALPTVQVYNTVLINGIEANSKDAETFIEAPAKYPYSTYATYYATLQQAVETAKTVMLVNDVTLRHQDATKVEEKYDVLVNMSKATTLDLNGHTIEVDHESATKDAERIYAVVFVPDGAKVTVKDTADDGGINVIADASNPKVAYMFWKRGTTGYLNIENGTYHMNNSEDSMVYTNGTNIVNVKGGTWILDAAGSRVNGFPHILNTEGKNSKYINVSGGYFSTDIAHQFWANEVAIAAGKAVKKDGKLWTLDKAVACIEETATSQGSKPRIVNYASLADAIAAIPKNAPETTVKLLENVNVTNQFIGHSYVQRVILDLNGKSITSTDKALTVYRKGTEVLIKNGTISGNTSGGTIQVTYGGKLTLGDKVNVKSGSAATALKVDANSTLIIEPGTQKVTVTGGKEHLVVADGASVQIGAGTFNKEIKPQWCYTNYVPSGKAPKCTVVLNPGLVAQLDSNKKYYTTLAEAIADAEPSDTITLVNTIALANESPVDLDGKYDTYFNVDGKSITINLNSKDISGTYVPSKEGKMLVGLFSTANNGHLTLNGNSSSDVSIKAGTGNVVYALIVNYNPDCSIVINGGDYALDKASDSLIYSHPSANEGDGNVGIIVNGGSFNLKNLGKGPDGNGSPWIFNAKGRNQGHIWVTGGTFYTDISNQYWSKEVQMPEGTTVQKTEGKDIWTVVPPAAEA